VHSGFLHIVRDKLIASRVGLGQSRAIGAALPARPSRARLRAVAVSLMYSNGEGVAGTISARVVAEAAWSEARGFFPPRQLIRG
jgi:hypothetical protein